MHSKVSWTLGIHVESKKKFRLGKDLRMRDLRLTAFQSLFRENLFSTNKYVTGEGNSSNL